MYILQYIIDSVGDTVERISTCLRTSNSEEAQGLVSGTEETPQGNYSSLDALQDDGDEERGGRTSRLGLTAEFKSWIETDSARQHAIGHMAGYLFVAVMGFSFVFEKWPIVDSLYFAIVVFTTVGYGDISPTNDTSRIFVICFALYGIIILGIFLGIVGSYIMEKHDETMNQRMKNARTKVLEQFEPQDTSLPPKKHFFFSDLVSISIAEAPIIVILAILAIPIVYIEHWDPIMGAYWMVVTGTTIGFGDLGPTQALTRAICIFWIPLAVAVLGEFLGRVANCWIDRRNDDMEARFLKRAMTLADLERMDTDDNDKVTPDEFLRYMLVSLQKVEADEIDEILELFHKLDKSNTGAIDKADLMNTYNLNVRPGVAVDSTILRT